MINLLLIIKYFLYLNPKYKSKNNTPIYYNKNVKRSQRQHKIPLTIQSTLGHIRLHSVELRLNIRLPFVNVMHIIGLTKRCLVDSVHIHEPLNNRLIIIITFVFVFHSKYLKLLTGPSTSILARLSFYCYG